MQQKVEISNQQIAQAAANIGRLLNDDERVSLPPSMARSGDLVIMDVVLGGLSNGTLICVPPEQVKEEFMQPSAPPGANGADAGEGAPAEE